MNNLLGYQDFDVAGPRCVLNRERSRDCKHRYAISFGGDQMAKTSKPASAETAKSRQSASGTTGKGSARKPNAALMKPVQPSEELAQIVGKQPLSRPELTK